MALIEKNVTTLTELKTLVNQGNRAAVLYDVSTGEPYGLDLEVLIAMDNAVIHSTGDETVAGVKTFSSSPIVPNPTTDLQADNKGSRTLADSEFYAKAIEPIAYNATAPTPNIPIGTTKTYKFSTGGAVSWLSSQIMEVGDEADVTRTGESTYTRMSRNVLSRKVDDTQIYNGLDKTQEGFALDVLQGKALDDKIENLFGDISSALDEILLIGGSI